MTVRFFRFIIKKTNFNRNRYEKLFSENSFRRILPFFIISAFFLRGHSSKRLTWGGAAQTSEITLSGKIAFDRTDTGENAVKKNARSAFPDLTNQPATATIYYTVKASSQGQSEQTAEVSGTSFTIKLPLKSGQSTTWTLYAEGYSTESDRKNKTNKIVEGSKDVNLTSSNPVDANIEIPVKLSAPSQSGNGNINLKVKAESGTEIQSIKATFQHESQTNIQHTITQKHYSEGQTISLDRNSSGASKNMKAGVYTCTLEFFKGKDATGTLLYRTIEKVTLVQGLTTNSWQGSSYIGDDGILTVTSDMVKNFRLKTFYVAGEDSTLQYANVAKDENHGTYFDPLKTIQKAVDKIIDQNDGTSAYTIYADGTFTLTNNTSESGTQNLVSINETSKKLTLTIKGAAYTKAVLDGNKKGRVFNIEGQGNTLIYLENLEIKNGNVQNENGAGIKKDNGTVRLTNCIVSNNTASNGNGGGIYINGGELVLYQGTNATSGINEIKENTAKVGGGIYSTKTATVNISNYTELDKNSAENKGGTIYIESQTTLTISASKITNSKIKSDTGNNGGEAIYISGGSTLKLFDTEISWAKGITPSNASVHMEKGTTGENDAILYLGGTTTIQGTTGIRLDKTDTSKANIIITKKLNPPKSEGKDTANIRCYYTDPQDKPIIKGEPSSSMQPKTDGYTLTQDDCDNFDVCTSTSSSSTTFKITLDSANNQGKLTQN